MAAAALLLTGTRGAGKSAIAERLAALPSFALATAVTTRPKRAGDIAGAYNHIDCDAFLELGRSGLLLTDVSYGGHQYGITRKTIHALIESGLMPVLTVTPEAAASFGRQGLAGEWLTFFVDAPDDVLDKRLIADHRRPTPEDYMQRSRDREYYSDRMIALRNSGPLDAAVAIILALVTAY